jgi:hypothetical protein
MIDVEECPCALQENVLLLAHGFMQIHDRIHRKWLAPRAGISLVDLRERAASRRGFQHLSCSSVILVSSRSLKAGLIRSIRAR